jgi:hypothetical protein
MRVVVTSPALTGPSPHRSHRIGVQRPTPDAVIRTTRGDRLDRLGLPSCQATVTSPPSRWQASLCVSQDEG